MVFLRLKLIPNDTEISTHWKRHGKEKGRTQATYGLFDRHPLFHLNGFTKTQVIDSCRSAGVHYINDPAVPGILMRQEVYEEFGMLRPGTNGVVTEITDGVQNQSAGECAVVVSVTAVP